MEQLEEKHAACQALRNRNRLLSQSPNSVGMIPLPFLVLEGKDLKVRLRLASGNAKRI